MLTLYSDQRCLHRLAKRLVEIFLSIYNVDYLGYSDLKGILKFKPFQPEKIKYIYSYLNFTDLKLQIFSFIFPEKLKYILISFSFLVFNYKRIISAVTTQILFKKFK